jgi:hypothetical protein
MPGQFRFNVITTLSFLLFWGCAPFGDCKKDNGDMTGNQLLNRLNNRLTEATIAGTLSPPAAARCFAYANIGAYEAVILGARGRDRLSEKLHQLSLPKLYIDTGNYLKELGMVNLF